MLRKISIALLLVCMGSKALSQDNLKTNNLNASKFAIVEIFNANRPSETVKIYYDDGKIADVTGKLYNNQTHIVNTTTDDFGAPSAMPMPQKALYCIKYMDQNGYSLLSSTNNLIAGTTSYSSKSTFQYVFEKKEK